MYNEKIHQQHDTCISDIMYDTMRMCFPPPLRGYNVFLLFIIIGAIGPIMTLGGVVDTQQSSWTVLFVVIALNLLLLSGVMGSLIGCLLYRTRYTDWVDPNSDFITPLDAYGRPL